MHNTPPFGYLWWSSWNYRAPMPFHFVKVSQSSPYKMIKQPTGALYKRIKCPLPLRGAGRTLGKSNRLNSPGLFGIAKIMLCSFHCRRSLMPNSLNKFCMFGYAPTASKTITASQLSRACWMRSYIWWRISSSDCNTLLRQNMVIRFSRKRLKLKWLGASMVLTKYVQSSLIPVPIFVLPCCNLQIGRSYSSENLQFLNN